MLTRTPSPRSEKPRFQMQSGLPSRIRILIWFLSQGSDPRRGKAELVATRAAVSSSIAMTLSPSCLKRQTRKYLCFNASQRGLPSLVSRKLIGGSSQSKSEIASESVSLTVTTQRAAVTGHVWWQTRASDCQTTRQPSVASTSRRAS